MKQKPCLSFSASRIMRACLALGSFAVLCGCAGMRPPKAFPDLDGETSQDALVVAKLGNGNYLPEFPKCKNLEVICMDPPPFWFRARVQDVVFGSLEQSRIIAATTSHYGMGPFVSYRGPELLRLAVDGDAIVMLRYAYADLHADKIGDLFVILRGPEPIWWLPCSAMDLIVDIDARQFADDLMLPKEYVSQYEIEKAKDFLVRTDTGYLPRKGLPVAALKHHLDSEYAGQKLPRCEPD